MSGFFFDVSRNQVKYSKINYFLKVFCVIVKLSSFAQTGRGVRKKEMKGKVVVATDKAGKEYRFPSILSAAIKLNLSMTTIKTRATSGKPIATAIGEFVIRFDK